MKITYGDKEITNPVAKFFLSGVALFIFGVFVVVIFPLGMIAASLKEFVKEFRRG